MTDARRLAAVRWVHTAIYLIMAAATFVLLYAGATGAQGTWLWIAAALLGVEVVVFVGNGMKCPLTTLAVRYGAETGHGGTPSYRSGSPASPSGSSAP